MPYGRNFTLSVTFGWTFSSGLSGIFGLQGKHEEAQRLEELRVEKSKAVWGPDHPKTLLAMNDLGVVLISQGKYTLAQPLLKEALAKQQATLGEGHNDTLHAMNNNKASTRRPSHFTNAVWNDDGRSTGRTSPVPEVAHKQESGRLSIVL
jgi:hypothetical protein